MKKIFAICMSVLFLMTSCNNIPVNDGRHTENDTEAVQSETRETSNQDTYEYIDTHTVCPPEWVMTEYSAFNRKSAVIAEFGEPILTVDSAGGESVLTFTGGRETRESEFAIFPAKIHKKFEATAYSDESFFNTQAMIEKEEELGIDRTQTYLNFVLDYPNKDEIMAEYDDIILIESEFAADIVSGEKYFISMFFGYIDYPHLLYGEYDCKTAYGWMPLGDRDMNKPDLVPVKDDKICLPEDFYQKQSGSNNKYYISRTADMIEYTNGLLTQLGLTDNLFRDGMTIDELDEYFNLVTNKETFAPLFENAETQAP